MKKIIVIILLALAAGGTGAYYLYNKPAEKTVTRAAELEVTAEKLFSDYSAHEEKANGKYLNKVLLVSGTVSMIDESDKNNITYTLSTGDPMGGVICTSERAGLKKTVKAGDLVKVKGICTGLLMDVVLVKCSIE